MDKQKNQTVFISEAESVAKYSVFNADPPKRMAEFGGPSISGKSREKMNHRVWGI